MTRRTSRQLPSAPLSWDPSSRETWNQLLSVLENSELFDRGRRTRPLFIVRGTVSAPVTLDVNNPEVTALTHVVARLLQSLAPSPYVDIR